MATITNNKALVEDEWYHVRHSGEIPEIALHSSIHYLTEDCDGPQIVLCKDDTEYLLEAAMARYVEIIMRDIDSENRDSTSYRGVLRAICNWRRLKRFCQRHDMDANPSKTRVAPCLAAFLQREVNEVQKGMRSSSINCTYEELRSFIIEMDLSLTEIDWGLQQICPAI